MFGRNTSEAWLDYADRAYVSARLLWFTHFTLDAPVAAHRAIELYLKSYLIAKGHRSEPGGAWGHDLEVLRLLCCKESTSFEEEELSRRIRYFQRYFDLVRYPSDLDGKLNDGSGIWFTWDAVLLPLDQLVAFIRPRVPRMSEDWGGSWLASLNSESSSDPQSRALKENNEHLDLILGASPVGALAWDPDFNYDRPGC